MTSCRTAIGRWIRVTFLTVGAATASDWPQFMRDSAHTGDAADEALTMPLGLVAQVKLDDAVMTSPAVVGGLVYVVDQMGTAYCIDPKAGRILWKISPDGEKAMGSNTSSPCVAKKRVYYGTTAGTFHILDAKDGKVVKTLSIGMPILSSPAFANDSIYFQALDAVVRCLDLDGNEKWTWDHYARYKEPPETTRKEEKARCAMGGPDSIRQRAMGDQPHYGGREVAVLGKQVVTSIGWDLICLDDRGRDAELAWCRRVPEVGGFSVPMGLSISGEYIYAACVGGDNGLRLMRFPLKDGAGSKEVLPGSISYPFVTPTVRGSTVSCRHNSYAKDTITLYDWENKNLVGRWRDDKAATRVISSHTLTRDHCVVTTFGGDMVVFELNPKPDAKSLRVKTPHGKAIGSSPVVSGGCVYFGCDDGYFYVYGLGGALEPRKDEKLAVHEPRSKVVPATGKVYGWTSSCGNAANSCFVDDANFKPPLRLRWATRTFGHYKTPSVATADGDVVSVTCRERMVTCQEQATGRLRWRLCPFPEEQPNSAGLLVSGRRVYVPCPNGNLFCLDQGTGAPLWSAELGSRSMWSRASPLLAGGNVIFGHVLKEKGKPGVPVVQAWNVATGESAWKVELNVNPDVGAAGDGCVVGDVVYFSAGREGSGWKPEGERKRGETVAIDARNGTVIWRSQELFKDAAHPFMAGDHLFLRQTGVGMRCVSAQDGKLLWTGGDNQSALWFFHSVGPDYITVRGSGGDALKFRIEDGKPYPGLRQRLGNDSQACGPLVLTPNFCLALAVSGLRVQDVKTGAPLWQSPGFAPVGCHNVSLANGRVFWPSAASGVIFCWEPAQ